MIRSRLGAKVLGLCILALGLMAVGAAGPAHAEVGSFWGYLNANNELIHFGPNLEPELEFEIEELFNLQDPGRHLVLLTKIGAANVAILCTGLGSDLKLKAEGLILGLLTFHGCITKLNGVTSAACTPKSAGQPKGLIKTFELDGLIELHKLEPSGVKDDVVRFKPDLATSETLMTVQFNVAEGCALPESVPFKGRFYVQDCLNEFLVHKVVHLWEEFAPLTHMYAISDTVEHKATLDGSVNVFLKGAHVGLRWAGTPA